MRNEFGAIAACRLNSFRWNVKRENVIIFSFKSNVGSNEQFVKSSNRMTFWYLRQCKQPDINWIWMSVRVPWIPSWEQPLLDTFENYPIENNRRWNTEETYCWNSFSLTFEFTPTSSRFPFNVRYVTFSAISWCAHCHTVDYDLTLSFLRNFAL